MIMLLGWLTVLAFVFLCFLTGLPGYIMRIDEEILDKHRKPVPVPVPDERRKYEKPKLVK